MPKQVRIEFEGAMDHVMARRDRREANVRDDGDRRTFVRTLGEASVRAGFRVHAYVQMNNHYHWLLETPKANLSRGMGWMQNAFTRQINTRHRLWGLRLQGYGGRAKGVFGNIGLARGLEEPFKGGGVAVGGRWPAQSCCVVHRAGARNPRFRPSPDRRRRRCWHPRPWLSSSR